MANEQNRLNWIQLDKDDSINELIDKFNFNFSLFALNNGGMPGANGKDADDPMVTYSRCAIHGINITDDSESDSESEYDISEAEAIQKIKDCIQNGEIKDLQKYDIIIIGNLIYQYLDKDNYHLISKIYGKKGKQGDKGESSNNYFKPIYIKDNFYSLSLEKDYKSIILDESDKVNPGGDKGIDNNVFKYSLIFPKNTDGITFLNNNTQVSTISHTSYANGDGDENNGGDIFRISDFSSKGSIYESDNELILRSGREKKDTSNVDNEDSYNSSLSIMDGFTFNTTFNTNKKELKITGTDNGTDISSNDTISIEGKNLNLKTKDSSNGKITLFSNIDVKNKTITVLKEYKTEDKAVVEIKPDGSKFNKIHADTITITIPTDDEQKNITENNIIKIFAKLNGAFKQFVDTVKINNNFESDEAAKQELRNQIGATSEDNVRNLISEMLGNQTFAIYNYCPIGTILTSIINKGKHFTDNSNNVFVLCDGTEYSIIKEKDKDTNEDKFKLYIDKNNSFDLKYSDLNDIKNDFGLLYEKTDNDTTTIKIPDLSDKFLYGTTHSFGLGNIGGSANIKLNADNIPAHNHLYVGDEEMWDSSVPLIQPFKPSNKTKVRKGGSDNGSGNIYYTSTVGRGREFNILPPYYKVFYYVKITDFIPKVNKDNSSTQTQQPGTQAETKETPVGTVIYDGSESDSEL